jgi:hypothetical protein
MESTPASKEPDQASTIHEERYEFSLPGVDIGCADTWTAAPPIKSSSSGLVRFRDTISFTLDGKRWKLRRLVKVGDERLPADTHLHRAAKQAESCKVDFKQPYASLELATDSLPLDEAEEIADHITKLLSVALGQRVSWDELWVRKDHVAKFRKWGPGSLALKPSGSSPLRNQGSGELKRFLETAYPIVMQDLEWWNLTIAWFVLAYETPIVDLSGMVNSMLLERISDQIRKEMPKSIYIIGEDLLSCLKKSGVKKDNFKLGLTNLMQQTEKNWTSTHTEELVREIKRMNEKPSYEMRVTEAHRHFGLKEPSPIIKTTRNNLMHTGDLKELRKTGADLSSYDDEVRRTVVILLMCMLKHEGRLFVPGLRECSMDDFKSSVV